jgi:nucleoside-diphosphate-sugar epimerase
MAQTSTSQGDTVCIPGTVLLTGASGFIGGALLRYLRTRGVHVIAMQRKPADGDAAHDILPCDLAEPTTWPSIPATYALIHCAAVTSTGKSTDAEAWRVNVTGTQHLLAAARAAGTPFVIYLSTMSAHPQNPSTYARTKLAAESLVRDSGMRWTILRSGLVVGPDDKGIFAHLASLTRRSRYVPVIAGSSHNLASVYVGDLCEVVLRSLCAGGSQLSLDVAADERLSIADIVREVARFTRPGEPPILLPIPYPLALAGAVVVKTLLPFPPLTPDNVYGIRYARPVQSEQLRAAFGITLPRLPANIARAVAEGAAWLQRE